MSVLTIYKASAGSGKTYTLTREYLLRVLSQSGNYRRILAVTFTNKATAEMKARILRDLHKLAAGYGGGLETELCETLRTTPAALRLDAVRELHLLLHDYTRFAVLTIDSFFQRILRSFSRETGLLEGYQIELNTQKVVKESVDNLIDRVGSHPELLDWLSDIAVNRLKEGTSWNFTGTLLELGGELFKEALQVGGEQSSQESPFSREALGSLRGTLYQHKGLLDSRIRELGAKGVAYLDTNCLFETQFMRGNQGPAGFFSRCVSRGFNDPTSYVRAALDDSEKWCTKTCKDKEELMSHVEQSLHALLRELVEYFDTHAAEWLTIDLVLKFLPSAGVMADLSDSITHYLSENNQFLLARSSAFIQRIIRDTDTPFLYEKMGEYYRYFMIDEFQDTSRLQWANFRPMIVNALASGNSSLIVGDVKQAIYRWRDTDWKLLASEAADDVAPMAVRQETLRYNWRSDGKIVDFNNRFFARAAGLVKQYLLEGFPESAGQGLRKQLTTLLDSAYADLFQELPVDAQKGETGYVQCEFLEDSSDNPADEQIRERLVALLVSLQQRGFALRDISILVRKKQEALRITDWLQKEAVNHTDGSVRFDLLSNDSLLLESSPAVAWMVTAMQYLVNPDDQLSAAFLWRELNHFFPDGNQEGFVAHPAARFEMLRPQWSGLSLYELCSGMITEFGLTSCAGQWPYIQAFLDVVLDYSRRRGSDLSSFLDYWEEQKGNFSVKLSEQLDAIQLLTIHKAKGLEFKVVIVPFCNWSLDENNGKDILWVKPTMPPYSQLHLLPVKYDNKLRNSLFVKDFYDEQMMNYADSLNLLYVALTRACTELYVMAPTPKNSSNGSTRSVAHLLLDVLGSEPGFTERFSEKEPFSWGVAPDSVPGKVSDTGSGVTVCDVPHRPKGEQKPLVLLLRNSRLYAPEKPQGQRERGTLMHELFCRLKSFDEYERVLQGWREEGVLDGAEMEQLRPLLQKASTHPQISGWFSGDYKVRTEVDLLLPGGAGQRPDRVMTRGMEAVVVDYKFGEKKLPSYRRQVERYCETLREMGFAPVTGYIWYVMSDSLEAV